MSLSEQQKIDLKSMIFVGVQERLFARYVIVTYVCMHVRMCACTYVCMYICMSLLRPLQN